jgi:aspartate aminotransferase-like enzyme
MPVADLDMPSRLLAGCGPSCADPRVLRAMSAPLLGQFDPDFTAIMDDVMELARRTLLTRNERCFAVSGLAAAGLEALLNTLIEPGDRVAVAAEYAAVARHYGAEVAPLDARTKLVVVPLPDTADRVVELAAACHAQGARLIVEATPAAAARELRLDDWGVDACVAGVDHAIGAPSGMTLVSYTPEVEAMMQRRASPPPTSYLDLLQLQAYWSPERLNHHTAPTSLVYGLREALRLIHLEGLEARWARHARIGRTLRAGLEGLGLEVGGEPPCTTVTLPTSQDEARARRMLLVHFGIHVRSSAPGTWRIGLLGTDARLDAALRVLTAIAVVLRRPGELSAALNAYGAE